MTKPRFTQNQHIEFGAKLSGMRHELLHCGTQLSNAYPRSGPEAEPRRHLDDAMDALEKARTTLERMCFGEHPGTAATTDYYPHEEGRARLVLPWER
jgi:hypothetical protein